MKRRGKDGKARKKTTAGVARKPPKLRKPAAITRRDRGS
jgi:hypothetical protein